jgi:hypothetical protein
MFPSTSPSITNKSTGTIESGMEFRSGTSGLGSGNENSSLLSNSGLLTKSSDISTLNDKNTNKHGFGEDDPLGTTDPGGDPNGSVIPISDGWGFLLLLAALYAIIKRYF